MLWLLEELGLTYDIVRYARNPATMLAPPELAKIHPLGKSPVVTEGGAVIAESGAILEYLAEKHGGGKWTPPAGSEAQQRCRYFLHYAEGSLMPILLVQLIASKIRSGKVPFFIKPITKKVSEQIQKSYCAPNLERHVEFLEQELEGKSWLCGGDEPTIADIQMSYPVEAAVTRGGARTPNLTKYLERMRARPAFVRALAKGGPVMPD